MKDKELESLLSDFTENSEKEIIDPPKQQTEEISNDDSQAENEQVDISANQDILKPEEVPLPPILNKDKTSSQDSHSVLDELPELKEVKTSEIPIQYDIKRFETSLNEPLKSHIYAADSAINSIAETNLNWDQQKVFDQQRNNIVGIFEQIIHLHDKYYFALDKKNLIKEAERGYYAHFEGPQAKNNSDFLILRESYQALKSYNLQLKNNWTNAHKILSELEKSPEIKKFIGRLQVEKVEPMLLICEQTDELIYRIALILDIKEEKTDKYSFAVHINAKYDLNKKYSITECFGEEISKFRENEIIKKKILSDLNLPETPQTSQEKRPSIKEELKGRLAMGAIKLGSVKDFSLDRVEKKILDNKLSQQLKRVSNDKTGPGRLTLKLVGKKPWNRSKFYQLSISKSKLEKIEKKLKFAVYFTDKPNVTEESYIRKRVIIGIARRNRMNLAKDLRDFLLAQVDDTIDDIINFFTISTGQKLLFTFHLGAGQLAGIQRKKILNKKIALCYISVPGIKNNKIMKEFYPELVDESIKTYWEMKINPTFNENFDNFWEFSKISDIVRNKYHNELEVNRRRLDSIFEKMDLNKATSAQKEKYFRDHYVDWFGLENIYTYKRFIERTIFNGWEFELSGI